MAAKPGHRAWPDDDAKHGAYTFWWLGGVSGWADGALTETRDGLVYADELNAYIEHKLGLSGTGQQPLQVGENWLISTGTEVEPDLETVPGVGPFPYEPTVEHVVQFDSTPQRAMVWADGVELEGCRTPCARELTAGRHTVRFELTEHHPREVAVEVADQAAVYETLVPQFGFLTVTTPEPGSGPRSTVRLSPSSSSGTAATGSRWPTAAGCGSENASRWARGPP